MHRGHVQFSRTVLPAFVAAIVALAPAAARAQCPQTELVSGLLTPLGLAQSNQGNLIVSETGINGMLHSGRLSIVEPHGSRRTLLDGLPSATNDVNEPSGPAGLVMRGRTIYLAIGIGDAILPGPAPGSALANPAPSSPLFSSILAIHLSADVEQTTGGLSLSPDDRAALAAGQPVRLVNGTDKITIELVVNFPDHTPNFRPDVPQNVRGVNPFALVVVDDQIFVSDGGQNVVRQVDMPTGTFWTVASFGTVPNPLFPGLGGPFLEAVPTGIRSFRDQLLVALFRGFPFPAGTSVVEKVNPLTGAHTPIIAGLTSAIDVLPVQSGGDLSYLVLEHSTGNVLSGAGQLSRMSSAAPPMVLAGCLNRPTSIAMDARTGTVYISEIVGGRIVMIQ